ncbi:MAG: pyridoxamine 5'-phosphate oxidase family protein [Deltaproteobacteria bacterium]|jgi:hypothetical protein|nr:pyridoxamine 5'-phosphate oxidase family protein [Deltaproteobacteria bacterium]
MSNAEKEGIYAEYIKKYTTMALATASPSGDLDCSTVYFALLEDGNLVIATDTTTSKAANMDLSGRFAATLDNGTPMGVKMNGTAEKLGHPDTVLATRSALLERIPAIKPFFDNPNIAFFRLSPDQRFVINFAWGINWKLSVD